MSRWSDNRDFVDGDAMLYPRSPIAAIDATLDETVDALDDGREAFLVPRLPGYHEESFSAVEDDDCGDGEGSVKGVENEDDASNYHSIDAEERVTWQNADCEEEDREELDEVEDAEQSVSSLGSIAAEEEETSVKLRAESLLGGTSADRSNAFATSRVKELLKFDGSSTLLSREAVGATTEAVALMLQDVVRLACQEASRRGKKTLTYDDIARAVQLYDRLSYLSDVLPVAVGSAGGEVQKSTTKALSSGAVAPAAASSTARHSSLKGQPSHQLAKRPTRTAKSGTRNSNPTSSSSAGGVHPKFYGGMRQETLRF